MHGLGMALPREAHREDVERGMTLHLQWAEKKLETVILGCTTRTHTVCERALTPSITNGDPTEYLRRQRRKC